MAGIVQDDNLFLIEPTGVVRFSLMWEDTGKRWQRFDMSADGELCIGRASTDDSVWAYMTDGTLLWEKPSECHEKGGFVSISPNGKYFGYADHEGPHICDRRGKVLFDLAGGADYSIPEGTGRNGIDIANDGSFIFSIGPRIYYRHLEN